MSTCVIKLALVKKGEIKHKNPIFRRLPVTIEGGEPKNYGYRLLKRQGVLLSLGLEPSDIRQVNLDAFETKFVYTDSDGDKAQIGSDGELVDAIHQYVDQGSFKLFATIKPTKGKATSTAKASGSAKATATAAVATETSTQTISSATDGTTQTATVRPVCRTYQPSKLDLNLEKVLDTVVGAVAAAVVLVSDHMALAPVPNSNSPRGQELFIHGRHTCDACLTTPVVGERFHAINLPDYDVCATCKFNYKGNEIQFAAVELDRDRPFQDRWRRRGIVKQALTGSTPVTVKEFSKSGQDLAVAEAIRRSLADADAIATAEANDKDKDIQSTVDDDDVTCGETSTHGSMPELRPRVCPAFAVDDDDAVADLLRYFGPTKTINLGEPGAEDDNATHASMPGLLQRAGRDEDAGEEASTHSSMQDLLIKRVHVDSDDDDSEAFDTGSFATATSTHDSMPNLATRDKADAMSVASSESGSSMPSLIRVRHGEFSNSFACFIPSEVRLQSVHNDLAAPPFFVCRTAPCPRFAPSSPQEVSVTNDTTFASDAEGLGEVAAVLGEAMDKVAMAIEDMNFELDRDTSKDESDAVVGSNDDETDTDDCSHDSWNLVNNTD